MSRGLTSAMESAASAEVVRPIYLVKMAFDVTETTDELNLWSGRGDLAYGGDTYTGVGDLLSISQMQETSDMSASGVTVTVTGIKNQFLDVAKDQEYQGSSITIILGAFDSSGSLIPNPEVFFGGFMDTMTIAESGEYSTISISAENKLIALERSKVRRYTAEDQKIDHPTYKGFEFVTAIVEKEIVWGRITNPVGGGSSGHGGGANPDYPTYSQ